MDRIDAKANSKACDQCYRRKVRCTSGGGSDSCTRCATTNSVCTYSLGKWMGRPKKRRQTTSKDTTATNATEIDLTSDCFDDCSSQREASASATRYRTPFSIQLSPNHEGPFGSLSPVTDDFMNFNMNDAFAFTPGNVPEVPQLESTLTSVSSNQDDYQLPPFISSLGVQRPSSCPISDTQTMFWNTPSQYGLPTPTSCREEWNAEVDVNISMDALDNKKLHKDSVASIFSIESPKASCNCAKSSLACLEALSHIQYPAATDYDHFHKALLNALSTAEAMTRCTICPSQLIVTKCLFIMQTSRNLVENLHQSSASNSPPGQQPVGDDVPRLRRRAKMLFAGLAMLKEAESSGLRIPDMQGDFLTDLSKAWDDLCEV